MNINVNTPEFNETTDCCGCHPVNINVNTPERLCYTTTVVVSRKESMDNLTVAQAVMCAWNELGQPWERVEAVLVDNGPGGGDSAGPRTPTTPPPPPRGLRPTVSCQRYEPKEPTGAEGAPAPKAPNGVM